MMGISMHDGPGPADEAVLLARTFHDVFGFDPSGKKPEEVEEKIVGIMIRSLADDCSMASGKLNELHEAVKKTPDVPGLLGLRVKILEARKAHEAVRRVWEEACELANKAGFKK